jgi:outer membrane receptor protein involved in Fe transport
MKQLQILTTALIALMRHAVTVGGSYERNNGTLAADFIYTDEDLFGFPDISYVNPVIPDRSVWQHDAGAPRVYNLGITGLFGQYILEPASRVVLTMAGRYDRLALDATRGTAPKAEETFDAFSPKLGATFKLVDTPTDALNLYSAYSQAFLRPVVRARSNRRTCRSICRPKTSRTMKGA